MKWKLILFLRNIITSLQAGPSHTHCISDHRHLHPSASFYEIYFCVISSPAVERALLPMSHQLFIDRRLHSVYVLFFCVQIPTDIKISIQTKLRAVVSGAEGAHCTCVRNVIKLDLVRSCRMLEWSKLVLGRHQDFKSSDQSAKRLFFKLKLKIQCPRLRHTSYYYDLKVRWICNKFKMLMVGTLAPHIAYCTKAQVNLDYTLHVAGSPSAALRSSCSSRDVMFFMCVFVWEISRWNYSAFLWVSQRWSSVR